MSEYLETSNNVVFKKKKKIQEIIKNLNSNQISVCVKVDIDPFVALANGEEYKLSSNYSNGADFIKQFLSADDLKILEERG